MVLEPSGELKRWQEVEDGWTDRRQLVITENFAARSSRARGWDCSWLRARGRRSSSETRRTRWDRVGARSPDREGASAAAPAAARPAVPGGAASAQGEPWRALPVAPKAWAERRALGVGGE